jgi:Spy/CpxP family protein refolding chaperone
MFKMNRIVAGAMVAVTLMGFSAASLADGAWAKAHPRRDQVNDRLARQNRRIHNEVKEGDLTHAQAAKLHKDDRQIRQEQRDMASQNGGHITKSEQRTLNQQENAVSRQIGK